MKGNFNSQASSGKVDFYKNFRFNTKVLTIGPPSDDPYTDLSSGISAFKVGPGVRMRMCRNANC